MMLHLTRSTLRGFTHSRRVLAQNLSSVAKRDINLRIIFGSQTGTAEAFANELEFDAQEVNINAEVIDALNFRATQLIPKDGKEYVNAFVVAVYGEGEPTDNAKKFFKSLEELPSSTRLDHVNYTVFGLGNSQCFHDRFNVIGKRLDKDLEAMGAKRVHPLGLGDATPTLVGPESMGERFTTWKQGLLARIQAMADEPVDAAPSTATAGSFTTTASANASSATDVTTTTTGTATDGQVNVHSGSVPISLSARQRAMVPANYKILHSTVSHVTQLFAKTDEMTAAVEVEFDLNRTKVLYENYAGQTCSSASSTPATSTVASFTEGLQPGDHVGVFAPNAPYVVDRFALAAGLTAADLDRPMSDFLSSSTSSSSTEESAAAGAKGSTPTTLRQVLTWQTHLSGVASLTSIKMLQRWMKDEPRLSLTAKLFAQLESKYDALVKDKGLDTSVVLDMIPKLPGLTLPLSALLKTLPTLNPRLYSITHMLLPGDIPAAQAVAAHHCPIEAQAKLAHLIHTPTAADDTTKVTLLCRLLRYRQTKSSANRVVDGVCSSFLNERLVPNGSEVALFFRQSNFHLPAPVPLTAASSPSSPPPAAVIMIAGGSGVAPFMSFLEARQRWLERQDVAIGPAFLYFGCRTNDEYIFRDKLVSYLDAATTTTTATGAATAAHPHGNQPTLDRLMVSFSMHAHDGLITPQTEEALHPHELLYPHEEHIPTVFLQDKDAYLQHLRTGGHVYVCGGAGQFGKAVREAVNTVAMEAFGMTAGNTPGEVHPGIRRLIDEKRYFEDLAD